MRFVSKYPNLGLGAVIRERFVLALDGQRDYAPDGATGWTGSVSVKFSQTGLTQQDIKFALARWEEKEFTGRWLDADGVTLQPIIERIGMYDTDEAAKAEGWTPEVKETVENWMLRKENFGIDYALVEKVPAKAPWVSYDRMHHNKIAAFAEEAGQLPEALEYERETKNRPSVIADLEARLAVEQVEGEVINA